MHQFASLEDLYDHLDKVSKERMRTALVANKENAFLSRKLFLLQMHPSGLTFQDMHFDERNWVKARPIFAELDFKSLLKDIDAMEQVEKGVKPAIAEKMVGYDFIGILSVDQLDNLCNLIKQQKLVAIDTETNGLKSPYS